MLIGTCISITVGWHATSTTTSTTTSSSTSFWSYSGYDVFMYHRVPRFGILEYIQTIKGKSWNEGMKKCVSHAMALTVTISQANWNDIGVHLAKPLWVRFHPPVFRHIINYHMNCDEETVKLLQIDIQETNLNGIFSLTFSTSPSTI